MNKPGAEWSNELGLEPRFSPMCNSRPPVNGETADPTTMFEAGKGADLLTLLAKDAFAQSYENVHNVLSRCARMQANKVSPGCTAENFYTGLGEVYG